MDSSPPKYNRVVEYKDRVATVVRYDFFFFLVATILDLCIPPTRGPPQLVCSGFLKPYLHT